jgi:tRNA nucleotidyltransferase/poly(A) polymerase
MKIELPRKVVLIIKNLQRHGYDAYAVGGCVRDSILNRKPEDWDITTSAKPEQVKRIFRRTVDTGIEHGTVTVLIGKDGFEVTTYRVDGLYEDGRHPKEVTFTSRLEEDLKRRDFTINAMAPTTFHQTTERTRSLSTASTKTNGADVHRRTVPTYLMSPPSTGHAWTSSWGRNVVCMSQS